MYTERRLRSWVPVLLLHRVVDQSPSKNPHLLCTSRGYLEWMLAWLRGRGYRTVPLAEAVAAMQQRSPPERIVSLTFDDGYRDFLTHAMPVLEANRCSATLFVVSSLLGGHNAWDAGYLPPAQLLSSEEVREIAARGIEIGSHSATHARLTKLSTFERAREIEGSRRDLESLLGRPVKWFAYPFLDQDQGVRSEVAEAGFEAAFGGEQHWHERFAIHRISVGEPRGRWLEMRLRGVGFKLRSSPPARTISALRSRLAGVTRRAL